MVAPAIYAAIVVGGRLLHVGYRAYSAYKKAGKIQRVVKVYDRGRKARRGAKRRTKPRKRRCASCKKEVKCFKKPKGMSDKEFDRQLKEQQDAINNTTADTLTSRRDAIRAAGGTSPLRDLAAQSGARAAYRSRELQKLIKGGMNPRIASRQINKRMTNLAATHRLDIIAGGDPSDISGLGDKRVNSSLGSQWRGARSQELEEIARQQKKEGLGREKMNVKLKKC